MGRWEPDARGRLERAAMELYRERGFDATTVAEIAERAGLTERTFFRYFADKREVLFSGASVLQDFLVGQVESAPGSLAPIDVVVYAFSQTATSFFEARRQFALARQAIIAANAELQERELIKLANLGTALAEALRARGVSDPTAGLAAEAGVAVFKIGFERWTADGGNHNLAHFIEEAAQTLKAVAAAP